MFPLEVPGKPHGSADINIAGLRFLASTMRRLLNNGNFYCYVKVKRYHSYPRVKSKSPSKWEWDGSTCHKECSIIIIIIIISIISIIISIIIIIIIISIISSMIIIISSSGIYTPSEDCPSPPISTLRWCNEAPKEGRNKKSSIAACCSGCIKQAFRDIKTERILQDIERADEM